MARSRGGAEFALPPGVQRLTSIRACAIDLDIVKDKEGFGNKVFLKSLPYLLFGLRPEGEIGRCVESVASVEQSYGVPVFWWSIVDWVMRKVVTKTKILPPHGFWAQAFWYARGLPLGEYNQDH